MQKNVSNVTLKQKQNKYEVEMIDEHGASIFERMGYDPAKLPENLEILYKAVKHKKDVVQPGRMGPEMCALIAAFADTVDGRIEFASGEKTEVKK